MAIVIEAVTVVIRKSGLDARFPGGSAACAQQVPNSAYPSDGVLAGVSFMVVADAKLFAGTLAKHGFNDPWSAASQEIAVIDESEGVLTRAIG